MNPSLALIAYFVMLLLFLRWTNDPVESSALWLPVIWVLIMASRLPSQWLGLTYTSVATAMQEGNSLDRIIYLAMIVLALWILAARRFNWSELFASNTFLVLFLMFALASIVWSDYPFVTFKRWFRDLGTYVMVLVVLSDPRPQRAVSTVIRRLSAILVCLSLVLIKYYPQMGILFNPWDGSPEYVGATTSKNMLGVACLISGLFFFWDSLNRWPERKARATKRALLVNVILIAITLRVLMLSDSATSRGCLALGCLIIMMVRSKWANPRLVKVAIPVVLIGYVLLQYVFDFSTIVAGVLGRDPTLHGRTGIWDAVLAEQTHPLIGFGYQNFWMGDRLAAVWNRLGTKYLNEAHNGYLETYLNLGFVGLSILVSFMIVGCRTICRQLTDSRNFASFGLALWLVTVFYNFTEAALGASMLWTMLLLCAIVVPVSDQVLSPGNQFMGRKGAGAPNLRRSVQLAHSAGGGTVTRSVRPFLGRGKRSLS